MVVHAPTRRYHILTTATIQFNSTQLYSNPTCWTIGDSVVILFEDPSISLGMNGLMNQSYPMDLEANAHHKHTHRLLVLNERTNER
jgi:hypothetical protein